MAKDKTLMYIGGIILLVIILIHFGVVKSPFVIELSRETIFLDSDHLNTANLEVLQEQNPLNDSRIQVTSIKSSTVTTRGPDPHGYFTIPSDGVNPPTGTGACKGIIGWSAGTLDQCCKALGYDSFYSDSGWNVCVGHADYMPEHLTISIHGEKVYTWDGSQNFPQYSGDISSVVNSACGLNTPLVSRSYSTPDCNNIGEGWDYNSTWGKCIKAVSSTSSCDKGSLIGVTDTENICGSGAEYTTSNPTSCILPLSFDTGNGYGTINLGLSVNQVSASSIIYDTTDCPEGFTLVNSVCYAKSDFSTQLAGIDTLTSDLATKVQELSSSVSIIDTITSKIDNGESITQSDIDSLQTIIDKEESVLSQLKSNHDEIASIRATVVSMRDSSSVVTQLDDLSNNYENIISAVEQEISILNDDKTKAESLLSGYSGSSSSGTATNTTSNTSSSTTNSYTSTSTTSSETTNSESKIVSSSLQSDKTSIAKTISSIGTTATDKSVSLFGFNIPYVYVIVGVILLGIGGIFLYKKYT